MLHTYAYKDEEDHEDVAHGQQRLPKSHENALEGPAVQCRWSEHWYGHVLRREHRIYIFCIGALKPLEFGPEARPIPLTARCKT